MTGIDLVRPFWSASEHWPAEYPEDLTVLICQNKTPELIRLCIESLYRFYPDVRTLVVNGSPNDPSGKWLRYKEAKCRNLTVWDRTGYDSHGVAMHEAIMGHVTTQYVLLLDSDVIVQRGGWIEQMYPTAGAIAAGSVMIVTRRNHACGAPDGPEDELRYAHPSCSIYDVELYKELVAKDPKNAFCDHGAPCVYTMLAAERDGLAVESFPVERYVSHLSGASWTNPRTIWSHDNGVQSRPLVTLIAAHRIEGTQTDSDYDIMRPARMKPANYVIHGGPTLEVNNDVYAIRMKVQGDYVCEISHEYTQLDTGFVALIRGTATRHPNEDVLNVNGFIVYRREYWQANIAVR